MAIIKCKMCGGDIELSVDKTYGTCDSCGSTMTFPKVSDEQRTNLFNRANHFRRQNEFDKAVSAYERILNEDNTDAEAHWGVVLSRFGIEYVEDPVTHERIPTCHRVQVSSILTDADYLAALQYAPDGYSRNLYEAEAKRIADIQKGILAISAQEKPYDVFICYKESTDGGSRTKDSILAQDIYYQLKQEGINVFFARITLEDKLGQQYEPYIFAALNSAKVMLVVGTKPEYFNAVWVKNEWSRYLALMKQDRSRLLIPCYRDMDAYDLPDELSTLQSQDMSKIGFMQDLIRGVKKVLGANKPQQTIQAASAAPSSAAAPLLRRAFMFLEDKEWEKAVDFCERVLNLEPENAEAYLGKLMAGLKVGKRELLCHCAESFEDNPDYSKALRFGDAKLQTELHGYIQHINERNEQARQEGVYQSACEHMKHARTEVDYTNAARVFEVISQYKDAAEKADSCYKKAEIARKDKIYADGKHQMAQNNQEACAAAIRMFESISGWKDTDELIPACQQKIQELKARAETERLEREHAAEQARIKAEAEARKRKQRNRLLCALAIVAVIAFLLVTMVIIPNQKYDAAMELMAAGKYEEAIAAFTEIEAHKDSAEQIVACETVILDSTYDVAMALMNEGKYEEAYKNFMLLNGYKDSEVQATVANQQVLKKASVGAYITFGAYEQDANASNGREDIEWLVLAKENNRMLVISRYALDNKPYNEIDTSVTWETCTLRKWLNKDFLNTAFNSTEQAMICIATVSADKNPNYRTTPGKITQDKVFLLSIPEVKKYFTTYNARKCEATAYAKKQGVWTHGNDFCWWLLRSPGSDQRHAAIVISDGDVFDYGSEVNDYDDAVRPALWINLEP